MRVNVIRLINFRNFENSKFEFSGNLIAITGSNGVGKTNLLDAIHYCSILRSHLISRDDSMIRTGHDFFSIKAQLSNTEEHELFVNLQSGKKKLVKIDGKEYERLADHIGRFPVVMIAPSDINLLRDPSEKRRRFIDTFLSQLYPEYLRKLQHFKKLLNQRNALLKSFRQNGSYDLRLLDVIDTQLEAPMNYIHHERRAFTVNFLPLFKKVYEEITNESETPGLELSSVLNDTDAHELLKTNRQIDLAAGRTTSGIHKDDLVFLLEEQKAKDFASQGQQKSLIFSVKLAQYEVLREHLKTKPILILDDLFEKLDKARISQLLALVSGEEYGQLFISDTDPKRVSEILGTHKLEFQLMELD